MFLDEISHFVPLVLWLFSNFPRISPLPTIYLSSLHLTTPHFNLIIVKGSFLDEISHFVLRLVLWLFCNFTSVHGYHHYSYLLVFIAFDTPQFNLIIVKATEIHLFRKYQRREKEVRSVYLAQRSKALRSRFRSL